MALSLPRFPSSPILVTSKTPTNYPNIQTPIKFTPILTTTNKTNKHHRSAVIVNAGEERQQQNPISESETTQNPPPSDDELTELGTEIKKAMMDREAKKDEGFWGGVAEEIGKIEWPAFNKVIRTTGVVMGVIAGSSVVLLTVNAVLAELSDRVFVGRGVQDFFG